MRRTNRDLPTMMRRMLPLCALAAAGVLGGCATPRAPQGSPAAPAPQPWERRLVELQQAASWQLEGRAAVAVGTQGWQASLTWQEHDGEALLHLAGPLGVGAVVLQQSAAGVSLNGAPPSDAVLAQLQDKLGFDLPLAGLRYWLLGVPEPGAAADVARGDEDRARQLTQAGWTVLYDKYMPVAGDLLPARMVLSREDVRVRIVVDRWQPPR